MTLVFYTIMYHHLLQFMILLLIFSLEALVVCTLSTFNGIVNNGEGDVCRTLTGDAILSLRSSTVKLDVTSVRGHTLRYYWFDYGAAAEADD